MQPSAQEKEIKTVPTFTTCGGKRQWCVGNPEYIAPSYAWQNDVKASVYKAWQISPIYRLLVEGAFVLDGKLVAMVPQRHSEKGGRYTATSEQNFTRRYAPKNPTSRNGSRKMTTKAACTPRTARTATIVAPTSSIILASQTLVHEDGARNRNALFSSLTDYLDEVSK